MKEGQIIEIQIPEEATNAPPHPGHRNPTNPSPPKKEHRQELAKNLPAPKPYEEHPSQSPETGIPAAPPSPSSPEHGQPSQPLDSGHVHLFDPDALQQGVDRFRNSLPSEDQYRSPDSTGDGKSPEAEKALVAGRLQGMIDQTNTEGLTRGGLMSTCNDGIDQGMDGLMDCADPGCRLLPACANTKEFKNYIAKAIPDDDVRGITSDIEVNDDDDGKIRALTMQVNVDHGSPRDIALEVEHNGKKQVVRLAGKQNLYFEKAYLLKDFLGEKAQGTWTLHVRDVFAGTEGTLRGWTLYVTREVH